MAKGRYEVTVRKGRKIYERKYFNDYDAAMDWMDFVEEKTDKLYAIGAFVEFRDLDPFK